MKLAALCLAMVCLSVSADPPRAVMDDPATKHVTNPNDFWDAQPGDPSFVSAVRASQTNGVGTGTGAVDSVNGHVGVVVLGYTDVGAQPLSANLTSWSALSPSSKQDAGNYITSLTGAILGTGPGATATSLGSFNSANLSAALTDETGSGLSVFNQDATMTNLTDNLGSANGLTLHLPGGGNYSFIKRSGFLRLTNTVNAGETLDFNHGLFFGIGSPNVTLGTFDMSSGTALVLTADGSGLTNIPESAVVGLVSDLAGKQSTLTIGNLTATSPLHFDNMRQVIGGAAVASVDNAAADGSTKGVATFAASDFNASSGVISLDYVNGQPASGSANGFLSSANWTTFNNKGTGNFSTNAGTALATFYDAVTAGGLISGSDMSVGSSGHYYFGGISGGYLNFSSGSGTISASGPFTSPGLLTAGGNETVAGTMAIIGTQTNTGAASFASTVLVGGNETVAGTLSVTGAVAHGSTFTNTGAANFAAAVMAGSTLAVAGNATLTNALQVQGNQTNSGTFSIAGATMFGSTLAVSGNAILTNNLQVQGTLTNTGSASLASTLLVGGAEAVAGALSVTGAVSHLSTLTNTGASSFAGAAMFGGAVNVAGVAAFTNVVELESAAELRTTNNAGTTGQTLTSAGVGKSPYWTTASGGSGGGYTALNANQFSTNQTANQLDFISGGVVSNLFAKGLDSQALFTATNSIGANQGTAILAASGTNGLLYLGTNKPAFANGFINGTNALEVDVPGIPAAFAVQSNGVAYGNGAGLTNLVHDPTTGNYVVIDEEFYNTSTTAQSIGTYGWIMQAINSGTVNDNVASVSGHPGIINILTTTSPGSGAALSLGDSSSPTKRQFQDLNTQVPWRFRVIFKLSSTNGLVFEAGLSNVNQATTNASTTVVAIRYDATVSQVFQLVTGDGTVTATDIGTGTVQTGVWYDCDVVSTTAGTVSARVNGGTYVSNASHVPSAQVQPMFRHALQSGSTANTMNIDAFKLYLSLPTRYP